MKIHDPQKTSATIPILLRLWLAARSLLGENQKRNVSRLFGGQGPGAAPWVALRILRSADRGIIRVLAVFVCVTSSRGTFLFLRGKTNNDQSRRASPTWSEPVANNIRHLRGFSCPDVAIMISTLLMSRTLPGLWMQTTAKFDIRLRVSLSLPCSSIHVF